MKQRIPRLFDPLLLYPYSPVAKPMPPLEIDTVCDGPRVCVSFSCAFVPYLLGLLEVYRWEDSFTGTMEEKKKSVGLMRELMEVIAMACCGDDSSVVTIHRVNPNTGYPEISTDDGVTWTSDPESVYNKATEAPPLLILDTNDGRCEMANNVVENLQDLVADYSAKIGAIDVVFDMAVELLVAAIGILLIGLLPELIIPLLVALIPKIIDTARLLTNTTQAYWDGLFTNAVWNVTRCIVYCNTPDDGKYSVNDWKNIQTQLRSQLGSGTQDAGANLAQMIDVWGVIGLKNASRLGSGAEGNCDDCECVDEWWYEFDFTGSAYNTIFHPFDSTNGHYVAGEGYAPSVPVDIAYLTIEGDLVPYGGLDLIGYIFEQTIDGATTYNRALVFNETSDNYDVTPGNVIDNSERWAGETGGALQVTNIAPKWIGPAAGGGVDVRLDRLVLHGKGTNPFGADNYIYNPLSP